MNTTLSILDFETMAPEQLAGRLLAAKEPFELFVHRRVDSPFPGDWQSVFKGSGYEFWALRELAPTDAYTRIDWKATARTGKYHVREYLAESYVNVMILYDVSQSMAFGRKRLLQAHLATCLAYSAALSNNGCGLMLFAEQVVHYLPPRMGWRHFRQIVHSVAGAASQACPHTDLSGALQQLTAELTGSLTFILSDFLYPFDCPLRFQPMLHGTDRHEVKALQLLEQCEQRLPQGSRGLLALYDVESKERVLLDLDRWQAYNQTMAQRLHEIRCGLTAAGIDWLVLNPDDKLRPKINQFMQKRSF